jgi:hypothetical protein
MNISKDLRGLIPPLSESEKAQLEANCKADGIRDALIIARYPNEDGEEVEVLADGHNRYEIAKRCNLQYRTEIKDFNSLSDVRLWMRRLQLGRRNLTDGWKWELAQGIREELLEKGKEKQKETLKQNSEGHTVLSFNDKTDNHNTQAEIAETLNWSKGKTAQAEQVWKKAPEEVKQAVRDGEMTIGGAYKEVKKVEKEKQKEAKIIEREKVVEQLSLIKSHKKETIKAIQGKWIKLGKHRIYCGSNLDAAFLDALPNAKFAFADPPYNEGVMDWDSGFNWQQDYLSKKAEIVAVTPGISQIQDFFKATDMPYKWSISAWITNGMTRGALGFGNWIYIALFSNLDSIHRNAQDFYKVNIRTSESEGHYHKGRKPSELLARLIQEFTNEGDVVIDNFLGSGTTLFACEELNRVCYAAEELVDSCQDVIDKYISTYEQN